MDQETVGRVAVERDVEIQAAPDAVWALVGRFSDMAWHPAVHTTDCPGGDAVDAVRVLTLGGADGPTIREVLTGQSEAGRRYSYSILEVDASVLPVINYRSELAVVAEPAGGGSVLRWKSRFDPAPGVSEAKAAEAIGGVYAAGLDAARQVLESR